MLFHYGEHPRALLRSVEDFGFLTFDLVGYPRRLCEADSDPSLVDTNVDKRRIRELATPAQIVANRQLADGDNWLAQSTRTLARLYAGFIVAEDPQRRLDASKAATLMHQVSLVKHIVESPALRKVLIGDEVGLGKTIEAGLITRQLIERDINSRVLYLAPARLVSNVAKEFREKLDIDARVWVAGNSSDARLDADRVVIASIQKAVFGENFDRIAASGPWSVLVVDECHHLSDWNPSGGKPNQSFRLVSHLVKSLPRDGRLILMSGTPHQGSEARFKNILRLLADDGKDISGAAGRVIFRTKDRVLDWRGAPLFPARSIRPPVVVQLGADYERWYQGIALLYDSAGLHGVTLRAAGWAKGQALQWAASSVQAGIGFLARLGIRRLAWNLDRPILRAALEVLRPYRGGSSDEPLSALFNRIVKQIGNSALVQAGQDDEEDWEDEPWRPDAELLTELLQEGIDLLRGAASHAKWDALCQLIDRAGGEKVVLFAQPVETVTLVAEVLSNRYGTKPAIIIGNQSDDERTAQVASFQARDGPRFLVSSKAGGEGLNMHQSRHLIHLDVPWNPMEMEQRIGRIHRFGSRKTILVDTIVAAGSREIDMYRIAREKLALAVRHLDPEQFESLFSRVMSLVPPKELESILGAASVPLSADNEASNEIGRLVNEGFQSWRVFDDAYRSQAEAIRSIAPGEASWADLATFLVKYGGAVDGPDASFSSFQFSQDEIVEIEQSVRTIKHEGSLFACGDTGGLSARAAGDNEVMRLGINLNWVQRLLRGAFSPERECGAAFVKLGSQSSDLLRAEEVGCFVAFLRQRLLHDAGRWVEQGVELKLFQLVSEATVELTSSDCARLIRAFNASTRIRDPERIDVNVDFIKAERHLFSQLRHPSEAEIDAGVRYAVWPIAVVIATR